MLNRLKKNNNEGFTIIEVMIVLAIAGLILLIVFLAIPALQRNSRNTQRKSESAALSGAYSEYVNNHGGAAPGAASDVTNNAKLSFYTIDASDNLDTLTAASTGTTDNMPDSDHFMIVKSATCDPTKAVTNDTTAVVPAGAGKMLTYSTRGGAIVYTTEGGSSKTTTCISAS